MEDNKLLTFIYSLFLGVVLALFVGLGINTFYPGPQAPEYPTSINQLENEKTPEEITKEEREYSAKQDEYQKNVQDYSLNVSIITIVIAVGLLATSLFISNRQKIIANGVLLGGLFTLLYSLIRGMISGDSKFLFIIVTIALGVVLYLGYRRFSLPDDSRAKHTKTKKK